MVVSQFNTAASDYWSATMVANNSDNAWNVNFNNENVNNDNYGGTDCYPISKGIEAIGLQEIAATLAEG